MALSSFSGVSGLLWDVNFSSTWRRTLGLLVIDSNGGFDLSQTIVKRAQTNMADSADSFSLLLGAEVDRARWQRGSNLLTPTATHPSTSRQISDQPSKASDIGNETSPTSEPAEQDEEPSVDFLGRVNSYSRIMRAYAQNQLQCPMTGTVPGYRKTMHDFTLRQLNHYRRSSKSAACSPVIDKKVLQFPCRSGQDLLESTRDEVPRAPMNTPDGRQPMSPPRLLAFDIQGIDFRKLKRSVTEPHGGSSLLLNRARDVIVT